MAERAESGDQTAGIVVLSDMALELQQEATACAAKAIRHFDTDTERAEFIKHSFDKQVCLEMHGATDIDNRHQHF